MANCLDVRLRGAHAARVREDEAKRAAPPRLYSGYYDAGGRGNEKVKDRVGNREGILLHPLHLLPVPLTVLGRTRKNDSCMCRFFLVNHASRLDRFTNK